MYRRCDDRRCRRIRRTGCGASRGDCFPQLHVRSVSDRRATAAPVPGQIEPGVLVNDIGHRGLEFPGVDMLRVKPAERLRRHQIRGVARRLDGTEVAAVTEHGEQIALHGAGDFRIGARWWTEMPRVSRPVLGVFENVEKMALRHPGTNFPFEFSQILWRRGGRQFSETRRAIGVQHEFIVAGKTTIGFGRGGGEFIAQHGGEIRSAPGNANGRAPRRELWFALGPGQQLRAVIAICFGPGHVQIARSQPVRDMGENANLKRPPSRYVRPSRPELTKRPSWYT